MTRYTPPTDRVSFEHKVRKAWVFVEAEIWHDEEGIYKVAIANVWLDDADVFDLLTPEDISEIEDAIEPAALAEAGDRRATGSDTIPSPYPSL